MTESANTESNPQLDAATQMLANRLQKNLKILGKWARQQGISCYRLYDNDLPEYAFAIDLYGKQVHMAEYQAPASIPQQKVETRREQAMNAVQQVLEIPADSIILKTRERQKGKQQYQVQDSSQEFFKVREGAARLWINLHDYLDTGLFLDHRPIRKFIYENARGKSFLNLFCYTASASVHAAIGGAESSLAIDLSNTYLDWARRNYSLNGIGGQTHKLKRGDCIEYLQNNKDKFDLIFLDPPTFSNSKRTDNVLDVQRDHVSLIKNAANKLNSGGLLIFSTNKRNFKLDTEELGKLKIKDYTSASLDKDFQRSKKIHQAWLISRD